MWISEVEKQTGVPCQPPPRWKRITLSFFFFGAIVLFAVAAFVWWFGVTYGVEYADARNLLGGIAFAFGIMSEGLQNKWHITMDAPTAPQAAK